MPVVRAARGSRVPLRRAGPRGLPGRPGGAHRRAVGALPVLPRHPQGPVRGALEPLRRVPPLVQRGARHGPLPFPRGLPPRRASPGDLMSEFRVPSGGRIDRSTACRFTFGGVPYTGHPGDTLASALLANGVHATGTSIALGRPRGIGAAWAEDPGGLVQIEEPFPEPMLLATTIDLVDGLVAHGLPGQGRLAEVPDSARYDAVHHHVDVLVVGAGPAGLAAALTAARAGA